VIVNRCPTVAPGQRHVVHIGRARDRGLEVRGRILLTSQGIDGHVTVRDPVVFFGRAFQAALAAEGVTIDGGLRFGRVPGATPIVVYRSSLARTLSVMLGNSQNLYAECVLKRLGEGTFESGAAAVLRGLEELGVDPEGLVVRDGSGLAHTNRLTARALYQTLQAMRDRPLFVDSLAAGGEGTLRRRYRDLGPRVRAKTGTIRGVSTLSGYVTGTEGGRYVFAILANGASVRQARRFQDLVIRALARSP
jgi:D-alanyl-D-alanine carboxypeptidase/D-alanyl-D-alanine-endopeptidase (penicillin-binding protein 4)